MTTSNPGGKTDESVWTVAFVFCFCFLISPLVTYTITGPGEKFLCQDVLKDQEPARWVLLGKESLRELMSSTQVLQRAIIKFIVACLSVALSVTLALWAGVAPALLPSTFLIFYNLAVVSETIRVGLSPALRKVRTGSGRGSGWS